MRLRRTWHGVRALDVLCAHSTPTFLCFVDAKREQEAGTWPVPALQETDIAPPTGTRLASLEASPMRQPFPKASSSATVASASDSSAKPPSAGTPAQGNKGSSLAKGADGQGSGAGAESSAASGGVGYGAGQKADTAAGTASVASNAKARARASTLDLYFRKLMQRAAEVVAELCLRRLQLPGDTADQVRTS